MRAGRSVTTAGGHWRWILTPDSLFHRGGAETQREPFSEIPSEARNPYDCQEILGCNIRRIDDAGRCEKPRGQRGDDSKPWLNSHAPEGLSAHMDPSLRFGISGKVPSAPPRLRGEHILRRELKVPLRSSHIFPDLFFQRFYRRKLDLRPPPP